MRPAGFGLRRPFGFNSVPNAPTVYSAQATALFARMTTPPDVARKNIINNMIVSLVASGVWAKLDLLYVEAAHATQAAGLNWIADANNLTPVNSPTFTTDRGYAGNGTTSYLDTGWLPSTGVQYVLNSATMGCYINGGSNTGGNVLVAMGCTTATEGSLVVPNATSGAVRGRINALSSAETASLPNTLAGLTIISRTDSTTVTGYRAAVSQGTIAGVSVARPAQSLYIGGSNTIGVFGNGISNRFACNFAGAGFTAQNVTDFNSALSTYLTTIGAS